MTITYKLAVVRLINKAFSLVETMVVLLIVSLLMLLSWIPQTDFFKRYQEEQFWQTFRQNWTYTITRSRESSSDARVAFYGKYVLFKVNLTEKQIRLNYPTTLSLLGGQKNEDISGSGATQAQSVRLHSSLDNTNYDIKFQLGYGGQYHVQEEN